MAAVVGAPVAAEALTVSATLAGMPCAPHTARQLGEDWEANGLATFAAGQAIVGRFKPKLGAQADLMAAMALGAKRRREEDSA